MARTSPDSPPADAPFWERKSLAEMSREEWESLCDGCGKCCLLKLQDAGTNEVYFTDVACRLLDVGTCRCSNYVERKRHVPDCVVLRPETLSALTWMPSTCAYRLLHEGRSLAWWHPLISGDPETVHLAGMSVRNRALSETEIPADDLEDRIVDWPV